MAICRLAEKWWVNSHLSFDRLPGSGRAECVDRCDVLLGLRYRRCRRAEQGISRSRLRQVHGFPKTPGDKTKAFQASGIFCTLRVGDTIIVLLWPAARYLPNDAILLRVSFCR